MAQKNDPCIQTTQEWLADYDNASGVPTRAAPTVTPSHDDSTSKTLLRYVDHRTTIHGSVVLEFVSMDHNFIAVRFFNVSLKSSRGNNYPAGKRGQFNPPVNGKFRQFWMNAVGKPPTRWSRVHKSMRSALKSLVFTGETVRTIDRNGQNFIKLLEVHRCD